jgi:hypothetical protein
VSWQFNSKQFDLLPNFNTWRGWCAGMDQRSDNRNSWDAELITEQYKAVTLEFKQKGYNMPLGPTIGPLGRSVHGGWLFETFVALSLTPCFVESIL